MSSNPIASSSSSSASASSSSTLSRYGVLAAVSSVALGLVYCYSLYREFSHSQVGGSNKSVVVRKKKKVRFQTSDDADADSKKSVSPVDKFKQLLTSTLFQLQANRLDPQQASLLHSEILSMNPSLLDSQTRLASAQFLELYQSLLIGNPRSEEQANKAQAAIDGNLEKILSIIEGINDEPGENPVESLRLRTALTLRRRSLIASSFSRLFEILSSTPLDQLILEERANVFVASAVIGDFSRFIEMGDFLKSKFHIRRFLEISKKPALFEGIYEELKKLAKQGKNIPNAPIERVEWEVYDIVGWQEEIVNFTSSIPDEEKEMMEEKISPFRNFQRNNRHIIRFGVFYWMKSLKIEPMAMVSLVQRDNDISSPQFNSLSLSGSVIIQFASQSAPLQVRDQYKLDLVNRSFIESEENAELRRAIQKRMDTEEEGKYCQIEENEEILTLRGPAKFQHFDVNQSVGESGRVEITPLEQPNTEVDSIVTIKLVKNRLFLFSPRNFM